MGRYPCHICEAQDAGKAYREMKTDTVRNYSECVCLEDGKILHWNYTWDDGRRILQRCRECGGLLLRQSSAYHSFSDSPDGYYSDWIPVRDAEEAELLNILMDETEFEHYPFHHLRCNNLNYFMTEGEDPVPDEPEELKRKIREKYSGADPEKPERLIRSAEWSGKYDSGI